MTGFPDCLKEVRVKFHVIDALYNKGQLGLPVKTTTTRGVMTETTDEAGFAHLGPFIPGEAVKVEVIKDGFDDVSQEFVADEEVDFKMVGMNPTGPDLRLILTWGPQPSDLDSEVKFFDASGNEVCKLYWNNKHCEDYATLDVDETNGGDNGPETISVKNVPEGIKVMYYVKDFSNKVGKTMSWKDTQAKGNLFAPNGGGHVQVPFDDTEVDGGKRYFIIGCFDNTGYAGFQKVGQAATDSSYKC
jgi:hypothetical protein